MAGKDYPLIRVWGANMGSNPDYIEIEVGRARKAGAPQTALYYQSAEHAARHMNGRHAFWISPNSSDVWFLFDEYLPSETRQRMANAAAQYLKERLTDILARIGYVERDRTYADVRATVDIEIDVDAWINEYGPDNRAHALEQIRTDVTSAVRAAFLQDKWAGLIEGDVNIEIGIEA